jgi:two-component system response regulator AlgR
VKVLIVDDEPLARKRLSRLLHSHESFTVVAEAENGEQAIEACNKYQPDVVLMDIRMPIMDGLVAARHLANSNEPPAVIFCTAYNDYALEAFDARAVDYLLKPVNRDKLEAALLKAQQLTRVQISALQESQSDNAAQRSYVSARSSRGIELIPVNDVRYFLADQKYVTVYYVRENVLCDQLIDDSLKELEKEFGDRYVRVHRNALVAVAHMQGLEKDGLGFRLKINGVEEGPLVSRRQIPDIRHLIQHL